MRRDDTLPEALPIGGACDEAEGRGGVLLVELGGERLLLRLAPGVNTVGSDAACTLRIAAPGIAGRHFEIDCGSAVELRALAPVRRNGRKVRRAALASGDALAFGACTARFVREGEAALVRDPPLQTRLWTWAGAGAVAGYLAVLLPLTSLEAAPVAPPGPAEARALAPKQDRGDATLVVAPKENRGDAALLVAPEEQRAATLLVAPLYIGAEEETVAAEAPEPSPDPAAGDRPERDRRRPPHTVDRRRSVRAAASEAVRREEAADVLSRMWAAWQVGALEDLQAIAAGSQDREVQRLGALARRFERAVVRARRSEGLAAVPDLEEALGIAEEIGRQAPAVEEVRRRLASLHLEAARRALAADALEVAFHHCAQALAIRPRDAAARALRSDLAARAGALYREAYALQSLDPARARTLARQAQMLALPDDPLAAKAAALEARLRGHGGSGLAGDGL